MPFSFRYSSNDYTGTFSSFTISPKTISNLNVKINNGTAGENITGTMVSGYAGNLTFTISSAKYYADVDKNGNFIIKGTDKLAVKDYTGVSASFVSADGNYKGSASNLKFSVKKAAVVIDLNAIINDGVYGSNLNGTMAAYAGTLTFTIDGKTYTASVDKYGKFSISGSNALNAKTYTGVSASFISTDGAYKGNATGLSFTIAPQTITGINVKVNNGTYGNNLNGTMVARYAGNLTLVIDGTSYTVHVNKGSSFSSYSVSFTLPNTDKLAVKSYTGITATFVSDDGNYKGTDVVSFVINPKTITPSVKINNVTYGENLTGSMAKYNGTLTVTINGANYTATVTDGKFTILGTDKLAAKSYSSISATFVSDDGTSKGTTTGIKFTVFCKTIANLNVIINDGVNGSNLNGTMIAGYPGTLSFKIGFSTYTANVGADGKFTIANTNRLAINTYSGVTATFVSADGNYNGSATNLGFKIVPPVFNPNVVINNATYGSNLAGYMVSGHVGNLTVTIDGVNYTAFVDSFGKFTILSTDNLDVKTYSGVYASFVSNDGLYKGNTSDLSFTISPKTIDLNIVINNATYGNDLTGSMVSGCAGNLTININGTNYEVVVADDGEFTILGTDDLDANTYNNVKVDFISADGKYKGNATTKFTINPVIIDIDAIIDDITYGDNLTGYVNTNGHNGTVTIQIVAGSGTPKYINVGEDGYFNVEYPLHAKDYSNVFVSFKSDDGNYVGSDYVNFTISPKTIDLNANINDTTYGNNLIGSIVAGYAGNLTVVIDGVTYNVTVGADGKFIILGTNNLNAKLYEDYYANLSFVSKDGNYVGNDTVSFIIAPVAIDIDAVINNITYGNNLTGHVNTHGHNGTVTIQIVVGSSTPKYITVGEDGYFNVEYNLYADNYPNVSISFLSDDGNYEGSDSVNFTVSPIDLTLNVNVNEYDYGDNITGTMIPGYEGIITFTINGVNYTGVVGEDGKFSIPPAYLVPGYYVANVRFVSDDGNYAGTDSVGFTINPVAMNPVVDNGFAGEPVTGHINTNGRNGTVYIYAGYNTLSATVGADGYFIMDTPLNYGDYVNTCIVFEYGEDLYETGYVNFTISPKKVIIEASDLTITAYATKDLVITLRDYDGSLLVGKEFTIVFNGKNYVRTTNESGQAVLSIKSSTVKTYTTTIKVAASGDYLASSKTVKVTIKAAYVTINDILKASTTLRSYMIKYKKAPSSITVGTVKCTVPQFSYLMSAALKSINKKKKLTTKIKVINVKASNKNYKVSKKIYKSSYLSLANTLYSKGAKGTLYSYVKIGGKKIGFNVYTFALAKILHYYKTHKNKLPNYCVFTSAFKA